jgi:chromosome segregation ATPase
MNKQLTTRIADLEGICWKHADDARSSQQQLYSATTAHQEECEELKQVHIAAIDKLKEQISDVQKLLDVTVEDRDRKLTVCEETQGQLQRTIDNLKRSIEQHDEELSQVESDAAAKINEKRAIISELEDKLESRDELIAELQAKLPTHTSAARDDAERLRSSIYAELSDKINEEYQARFETLWEAKAHDVNRQIDAQWEAKEQQFINGPRKELLELIEALRNEMGTLQEAKDTAESENRHLVGELLPSLRSHIIHQDSLLHKQKSDADAEISRLKNQWARLQAVIAQSSSTPPVLIDTDTL